MPGRELGRVGVMEIGHLFIPLGGIRAAQVRTRHERRLAANLDLWLKRVREIGFAFVGGGGRTAIDEEHRNRARSLRNMGFDLR